MYLLDFLYRHLLITLSVLGALLWFLLSISLKKKSYFLSPTVATHAALNFLFFTQEKLSSTDLIYTLLLQVAISSTLQFILIICMDIQARQAEKKRQKREEGRALLFTLPDKENSFIRERLKTTLSPKTDTEEQYSSSELQLEYMRKCIVKLKGAKLSPADRLAVENYSRVLTAYMSAESLSTQELHGLNDTFSALLKMSAKYAV